MKSLQEHSTRGCNRMQGRIHSFESFGTVDGPGIRYVVFFQGCPMRCLYCHNPDTWDVHGGTLVESDQIISNILRNQSFYRTGGLTASGGEPMLQLPFLTGLFSKAKEHGIHTCLDTSGILFSASKEVVDLLEVTDLVMLDIKHLNCTEHEKLTGHSNEAVLAFVSYLEQMKKPFWVRHVVVPGITDQQQSLVALGQYLKSLSYLEKLEVLPYHSMGEVKYNQLGLDYPLKGTPQLTKQQAAECEKIIRDAML